MSEAMGALGMAPPTFKNEELADVFSYLFITRYEGRVGDMERGRAAYQQKGCASCHGPSGEGIVGPPLKGATGGEPKERIAQRMWNHASQMRNHMRPRQIPWPRFEPDELAALLAFLADGWKTSPASSPGRGTP
jgi:mono/diheme cytochrome c family protein